MSIPTCTPKELDQLILESGYPFELKVATALLSKGYDVKPSHQFFHRLRQQEAELDILATREVEYSTTSAGRVRCVLELAIECKDNSLPYVLFGFPSPAPPAPGILDGDSAYSKIRSTDDKFPNFLAFVSLGDSRVPASASIKASHHQFNTPHRFYQASAVEVQNGKLKLHVSDRLRKALNGLAGYIVAVQDNWTEGKKALESGMSYDPTIWISFLALVHSGQHFRYIGPGSLAEAAHTTLFTSFHSDTSSVPYALDFISYNDLPAALLRIESSFDLLAKHLVRYLKKSPKPFPEGPSP